MTPHPLPEPQRKPFQCLRCGKAFGTTDGRRLVVNDTTEVRRTTRLYCRCGVERIWKPMIDIHGERML